METIFFDEAGYTGIDYLNKEQPVFALGSIRATEEMAKELKQKLFMGIRLTELKHSKLTKSKKGQDKTIRFMKYLSKYEDMTKVYVVHKKFNIITKYIDYIIENYCFGRGIDIYRGRYCLYFANYMYFSIKKAFGNRYFNEFVKAFMNMMQNPDAENKDHFCSYCKQKTEYHLLNQLLAITEQFVQSTDNSYLFDDNAKKFLNIEVSIAEWLTIHWSQIIEKRFQVVHDESKAMKEIMPYWEQLTSPDIMPKKVGYGTETYKFPLGINKTIIGNSKEWVGLQLADVVAGATTRVFKWIRLGKPESDTYAHQLFEIGFSNIVTNAIWPDPDLNNSIDRRHFAKNDAKDPLEFTLELLSKN